MLSTLQGATTLRNKVDFFIRLHVCSFCFIICSVCSILFTVKVPAARTNTDAAACIGPAVRAYTAMMYNANLTSGSTVIIMSGANANGYIAIQLALAWGAKVSRGVYIYIAPQYSWH